MKAERRSVPETAGADGTLNVFLVEFRKLGVRSSVIYQKVIELCWAVVQLVLASDRAIRS